MARFVEIFNDFPNSSSRRLDDGVHTKQELRLRPVEGDAGLCALAALYQALYHTFLSRWNSLGKIQGLGI